MSSTPITFFLTFVCALKKNKHWVSHLYIAYLGLKEMNASHKQAVKYCKAKMLHMVSQNTLNANIFTSLRAEQRAICWAVIRLFVCNSVQPGEMKLANTVLLSTLIWRIPIDFFSFYKHKATIP